MNKEFNDEITLNIEFSGEYNLLKWVLKKYEKALPYKGEILRFARQSGYSKNVSHFWQHYGVQRRAWNVLHKDLVIARLLGKIKDEDVMNLWELKAEFEDMDLS